MQAVCVRGRHSNSRQPSDLNKIISIFRLRDESSSGGRWGWGLICGIKIPQQDFVLKMQGGGVMREGVRGGAYLQDTTVQKSGLGSTSSKRHKTI